MNLRNIVKMTVLNKFMDSIYVNRDLDVRLGGVASPSSSTDQMVFFLYLIFIIYE